MCRVSHILIAICLLFNLTLAAAPTELLFLISSQANDYHRRLSARLRNDIIEQSQTLAPPSDYIINIRIVHEIFNGPGHWALLNILPKLTHLAAGDGVDRRSVLDAHTQWVVWCEDSTHVALRPLLARLALQDPTQALYLGHALHDHEATIIHHFAFFENPKWFPYPMTRAGVVLSRALLQSLAIAAVGGAANTWPTSASMASGNHPRRLTDFTIDAAHELAYFIYDNVRTTPLDLERSEVTKAHVDADGAAGDTVAHLLGPKRQHELSDGDNDDTTGPDSRSKATFNTQKKVILRKASFICPGAIQETDNAVPAETYGLQARPMNMSECSTVHSQQLYFAVKTCTKYHKERLPIIAATWARFATHIRYYSDVADEALPTISSGVPNVDTGHCAKTLAILKLAFKDIEQLNRQMGNAANQRIQWLVLTDDDTLLSVANIAQLVGCFNHKHEIYLGERYGYRLHATDGFNYITGGGGIVFSLPTVARILQHCSCPTPSAPDDMILGACLHAVQVAAIHSARFHQARPNDYASALLALESPISFHKFWQLDPLELYEHYFAAADRKLQRLEQQSSGRNTLQPINTSGNVSTKLLSKTQTAKEFAGAHCRRKSTGPSLTSQQREKDTHLEL